MREASPYRGTVLLSVVLLGLALRLWGGDWGLPHLYHPDEDKIVNHALAFGHGDLNPHYFGWPSLQMYVMFFIYGGYFVSGWLVGHFGTPEDFIVAFAVDPSNFYLLGRWLSAALGALTIWLTYAVGKRLFRWDVGLAGAFFLTFNYLHVKDSHYITPDVPVAFMVMAAFWFVVKLAEEPHFKYYVGAGILTGLAISVKYPAFVIGISLLTAHLMAVKTQPGAVRLFSLRAWIAAALIPVAFVIGTPYSLLDSSNFLIDLWHQKIYVSRPLPLLEKVAIQLFENPFLALGIGVYLFFLAGMILCLVRRRRTDMLLMSFPLAYLSFMLVSGGLQHRYLMPVLPFFCLLAGLFLMETIRFASRRRLFLSRIPAAPLAVIAVIALVLQPAAQSVALDRSLAQTDTRTLAKDWIENHIPERERIALESYGPPLLPVPTTVGEKKPPPTTEEWWSHRNEMAETAIYGRLKSSRWQEMAERYAALSEEARERANRHRPRYFLFELRPIPYTWQIRLATGQTSAEEAKRDPEYRYYFEPDRYLSENSIEYVVVSSSAHTSERLYAVLQQEFELIHHVKKEPVTIFNGDVPFYSFHNPALKILKRIDKRGLKAPSDASSVGPAKNRI